MSKNAWKTLNAWKARKPRNIMELGAPGMADIQRRREKMFQLCFGCHFILHGCIKILIDSPNMGH